MNALNEFDTDQLLQSVASGDARAGNELLLRHRSRLKRMVTMRIHVDLAARMDPSDVVQDSLTIAIGRLPAFAKERPIGFYPWLRKITLNRMADLYRRHVVAAKRTTSREEPIQQCLNDNSTNMLVRQFVDRRSSPSQQMMQVELRQRVKHALEDLSENDREIVVMRHLEELSVQETAEILGLPPGTVMSRHFQAVRRLRRLLDV